MGIAGIAEHFYAHHTKGAVLYVLYSIFSNGLGKTGPSGAGFKLYSGIEQGRATADALVLPGIVNAA